MTASSWASLATAAANRGDPDMAIEDDETVFACYEEEVQQRLLLEHGMSFLRFNYHETQSHFYVIAESCVSRRWSAKVDDRDDHSVCLQVTLMPPTPHVLDPLFAKRVEFGFADDRPEKFEFTLDAGRKLRRIAPITSCSPCKETPLWYGFVFEYAGELATTSAINVDFSEILFDPELSTKAKKARLM